MEDTLKHTNMEPFDATIEEWKEYMDAAGLNVPTTSYLKLLESGNKYKGQGDLNKALMKFAKVDSQKITSNLLNHENGKLQYYLYATAREVNATYASSLCKSIEEKDITEIHNENDYYHVHILYDYYTLKRHPIKAMAKFSQLQEYENRLVNKLMVFPNFKKFHLNPLSDSSNSLGKITIYNYDLIFYLMVLSLHSNNTEIAKEVRDHLLLWSKSSSIQTVALYCTVYTFMKKFSNSYPYRVFFTDMLYEVDSEPYRSIHVNLVEQNSRYSTKLLLENVKDPSPPPSPTQHEVHSNGGCLRGVGTAIGIGVLASGFFTPFVGIPLGFLTLIYIRMVD